jgi:hypothetical protein
MSKIDLSGLDKAAVFAALYNAAKPQGMGFLQYTPEPMTVVEAADVLKQQTRFSYHEGRIMKIDLNGETLDSWRYNLENGTDAAEAVIASLRETGEVNSPYIEELHKRATAAAAQDIRDNRVLQDSPIVRIAVLSAIDDLFG